MSDPEKIEIAEFGEFTESETLEFKESFDSRTLETIGAFANAIGGTILVGIRDDGRATGITLGANTLEEWAQRMQSKLQPRILPSIAKRQFQEKTIAAIKVDKAESPISVDGKYFKRVGRTNQIMSPDELRQRLISGGNSTWDAGIEWNATVEDLDMKSVQNLILRLNVIQRRPVPAGEDPIVSLAKLGLLKDDKPLRAAILLLGKDPTQFYPTAFIKAGRFRTETLIVDDKEFKGTLFDQIEDTMTWFQGRLETRLSFGKTAANKSMVERKEIWQYPLGALREAIANAVCHRSYSSDSFTTVRLYENELVISNPGGLPFDLRVEDLLQRHDSHAPNKIIATMFYNTGIIERWGTGTIRMAEELAAQGHPPPKFDTSNPNNFKLIFSISKFSAANSLSSEELNERQRKALKFLRTTKSITNAEYQKRFGGSKSTVTRDLGELVRKGLIFREGKTGKGTIYVLCGQ